MLGDLLDSASRQVTTYGEGVAERVSALTPGPVDRVLGHLADRGPDRPCQPAQSGRRLATDSDRADRGSRSCPHRLGLRRRSRTGRPNHHRDPLRPDERVRQARRRRNPGRTRYPPPTPSTTSRKRPCSTDPTAPAAHSRSSCELVRPFRHGCVRLVETMCSSALPNSCLPRDVWFDCVNWWPHYGLPERSPRGDALGVALRAPDLQPGRPERPR